MIKILVRVNDKNFDMSKKVVSFTVDEKVFSEWKKYVDDNAINASKLIERFIKEHLKGGGKK